MKTKILAITLCVLMIFASCPAAFAAPYVDASFDYDNKLFVVSGDVGDGAHEVTVSVYRQGGGAPVYIDQLSTSADGTYKATVPFEVLSKDTYDIIVSSDNLADFHTATKFFDPSQVPSTDVTNPTTPSDPSDKDSQKGGGSGGGISVSGNVIPVPVNPQSAPSGNIAADGSLFADVTALHWAKDAIEALASGGIINGVGGGMYAPDAPVTREQFAKMLIEAFGLEIVVGDTDFADVDTESWSYPYLISAYKYGVMNGYSATELGGSYEISRQDMAVMMWRMLDIVEKTLPADDSTAFADGAAIADYAKSAVGSLAANSIINGMGDNMFMPQLTVTRAMAAVIIHRTINAIG